jgi:signal transduction histidine kinase
VAQLGEALSAMHSRLASHAEGRTAMLAAIAHDLGTPLSRLAFWVEQLPDDARARAESDVDEMRAMIAAAIGYARDEMHMRADVRVDLGSLLDSLVEDMAVAGVPVTIASGPRVVVRGDPAALRRMFANLIDNAARYGAGGVVDWSLADGMATVHVDDHGPGIDPAQAEWLFEPFVRGDPSRNRATGGSGLGLAIVRSIARRHGGDATLANRAEGGARATVTLPVDR